MKKRVFLVVSIGALSGAHLLCADDASTAKDGKEDAAEKSLDGVHVNDTHKLTKFLAAARERSAAYVKELFSDPQGEIDPYKVSVAAAFVAGVVVGRRFSSIRSLKRVIQANHEQSMELLKTLQQACGAVRK